MTDESNIELTINFNDPDLDAEERDEYVQRLLIQMKSLDEVEAVARVPDPNPPAGNKALGGSLVGMLTAEVSSTNIKRLLSFLRDRLGGNTLELTIKASNGKEIKIKATSKKELEEAIQAAQKLIATM